MLTDRTVGVSKQTTKHRQKRGVRLAFGCPQLARSEWPPKVFGVDVDKRRQSLIHYPGQDSLFNALVVLIRSQDGWELLVIPVVNNLKELFPSPGCRVLRAEVV